MGNCYKGKIDGSENGQLWSHKNESHGYIVESKIHAIDRWLVYRAPNHNLSGCNMDKKGKEGSAIKTRLSLGVA